ncbi:glycosyl transferase [Acinetobacter sp. NCu2D-2]|uniref:glycosyltransferase n=1 Tax=Acinetobacter sp. NCu2D-2 TaxID=1608473 RepID=UPI0007CDAD8A|nr:glycosyltransferase [Acinetobacter sp. NCu2D-2]ANF81080.1 glycosyl transferase [Acinetobacter sp. NCu2D-2]
MKKKVVLAIFTLQGNGAERFALTLAKGINDAGHEAHIVYFKNIIDLPIPEGVRTHFFNYQKFRAIPKFMRPGLAAKAFDSFVRKHIGEPDLVLSNLFPVDFILSRSSLPNVHMVIHNTTSQEYAGRLDAKMLEQLKKVYLSKLCVAVSQGVEQDFREIFGENSRITTIYNPIDIAAVQAAAAEFQPDLPARYLVNVGKFKQQKRHDILIRAYAKAHIDLPLVLVGTGELMAENEKLAQDLGVADQVHFLGFQKNPYPYIQAATAMVVSSDFEGFSIAILEALALGTPVISTDCPSGPREVLPENCLVPVQDVDALAAKLRAVAQGDVEVQSHLDALFLIETAVTHYLSLQEI